MTARPKNSLLIPMLIGILVAVMAVVVVVLITDTDDTAATTTTTEIVTTTLGSTTVAPTTTTIATITTTTLPFGDTATVTNLETEGTPGPSLTDVRIGDHEGFVRIVFDLSGDGTPMYLVGYEDPPFLATSGDVVPVDGEAFLAVHFSPALRYEPETLVPTYVGDLVLDPGLDPIERVVFIDDFESAMVWVIGLTAEKQFTVEVLQNPLRVVVDIQK